MSIQKSLIDSPSNRVQTLAELFKSQDEARHEFAKKHGFAYRRAQDYRDCVVIRWKAGKAFTKAWYGKIDEYVALASDLSNEYNLWIEEVRMLGTGIYVLTEGDNHVWAIPNEYWDVQENVLAKVPKWAKVSYKKPAKP